MSKAYLLFRNAIAILALIFLHLFAPADVYAQVKVITGTVENTQGEPIPAVSVVEKGTTNGTITDANGKYSIQIESGSTLVFSFIGMKTQQVNIETQSVVNVKLAEDASILDEVVVVGYGTQKKSDLTGSVVSVGGDELKKVPVPTVAEALTGRLAGVQVTNTEGSPDSEIRIRVRGGASLTQDNSPLYIVDGFPVNSISDISPSDIQTIDVLKDASSTAIYGSRGANGVVIITTKSGVEGKVTVNFNSYYAFSKIAKTLDVLAPGDYARWQYEHAMLDDPEDISSYENYFGLFQDIDLYEGLEANDWQRQVYGRTGNIFSNDLSVRGGSDKFNFSANYARFDQRAIMVGSDYLRNNITLKIGNKPTKNIDLLFSLRYSDTEINGGGANEQNEVSSSDSRLKHSVGYAPIPIAGLSAVTNTNEQIAGDLINPLIATADNDRLQERKNFNIAGAFSWNIIENLRFRTDVGIDRYYRNDKRFYGRTTYFVQNTPALELQGKPATRMSNREESRFRNSNTVTYDLKKENHKLTLLAGQELLISKINELYTEAHGYPSLFTSEDAFKLTNQGTPFSINNYYSPDDKLLSFFGRANYELNEKYLVTAIYRVDGSSRFLGDNVWGHFPSISAGWKISEEGFMEGTSGWLDFLKLRASYGLAGNNNIPRGVTAQNFESNNTSWINNVENYWAPDRIMANPDLRWESTTTRNIGLDFGLIKGRVNGTLEVYQNNTEGVLLEFPVQGSGYDYQYRNMGETENKGIELSLSVIALDAADYGLNFNFNIAFNRNQIVSLGIMEEFGWNTNWASSQIGNDFLVSANHPVGIMYGYVSDGRYEVSDFNYENGEYLLKDGVPGSSLFSDIRPGMMKLKDLDGDNEITAADQQIIGNANPKHVGGFVLNGYAFGFDLTAAFNWSYGNNIYNANKVEFTTSNPDNQYRNLISIQAEGNRWTNIDWETGELITDPDRLAAANANTTMWSPYMDRYIFSDWAVEDGSFLRLNTLTLGYTLPASMVQKAGIENLRFYVTGYNVFVLTNYTGFDPEVSTRRRTPLTPGVDYSAYPRSKQLSVGLNLTF